MNGRVEHLFARRDQVGLQLRLPAQAVADRQVRVRLPLVLHEERRLRLRDVLRARLLDGEPADARLLQEQQQRTGDGGAAGALPRSVLVEPSEHSTYRGRCA